MQRHVGITSYRMEGKIYSVFKLLFFPAIRASGSSSSQYRHDENQFESFNSTLKVLFWSVFDPGQPGVVGCSRGIAR